MVLGGKSVESVVFKIGLFATEISSCVLFQRYMKKRVQLWTWPSLTGLFGIIEFGVGFMFAFGFAIRRNSRNNPRPQVSGLNIFCVVVRLRVRYEGRADPEAGFRPQVAPATGAGAKQ
jgi:hypothetical protein